MALTVATNDGRLTGNGNRTWVCRLTLHCRNHFALGKKQFTLNSKHGFCVPVTCKMTTRKCEDILEELKKQ